MSGNVTSAANVASTWSKSARTSANSWTWPSALLCAPPRLPAGCMPSLRDSDGTANPASRHRWRRGCRWSAGVDRYLPIPRSSAALPDRANRRAPGHAAGPLYAGQIDRACRRSHAAVVRPVGRTAKGARLPPSSMGRPGLSKNFYLPQQQNGLAATVRKLYTDLDAMKGGSAGRLRYNFCSRKGIPALFKNTHTNNNGVYVWKTQQADRPSSCSDAICRTARYPELAGVRKGRPSLAVFQPIYYSPGIEQWVQRKTNASQFQCL
jgi:hypothetical protein